MSFELFHDEPSTSDNNNIILEIWENLIAAASEEDKHIETQRMHGNE